MKTGSKHQVKWVRIWLTESHRVSYFLPYLFRVLWSYIFEINERKSISPCLLEFQSVLHYLVRHLQKENKKLLSWLESKAKRFLFSFTYFSYFSIYYCHAWRFCTSASEHVILSFRQCFLNTFSLTSQTTFLKLNDAALMRSSFKSHWVHFTDWCVSVS